jgi:hypothetical protein
VVLFESFKTRQRFLALCDIQDCFKKTAFRRTPAIQKGLLHEGCVRVTPHRLCNVGNRKCTKASKGHALLRFEVQPLELFVPIEQLSSISRLRPMGAFAGS